MLINKYTEIKKIQIECNFIKIKQKSDAIEILNNHENILYYFENATLEIDSEINNNQNGILEIKSHQYNLILLS